jgi:hypothetical protein
MLGQPVSMAATRPPYASPHRDFGDPVNLIDPMGTDWMDTAATFSAGFGDALLLGFGDELRDWTDDTFGWNGRALVDKCSGAVLSWRMDRNSGEAPSPVARQEQVGEG